MHRRLFRNGSNDSQQGWQNADEFQIQGIDFNDRKRGNGKLSRWQFAGAKDCFQLLLGWRGIFTPPQHLVKLFNFALSLRASAAEG